MIKYAKAMHDALYAATFSPDPSTQNGAALLTEGGAIVTDCNRFPNGVKYSEERWERPLKYRYIEHAERNAIFQASRVGLPTLGGTLVCAWAACSDCARAIVQSGISTLVRFPTEMMKTSSGTHWHVDCEIGDTIMREGGIEILESDFINLDIPELRRNGEPWVREPV